MSELAARQQTERAMAAQGLTLRNLGNDIWEVAEQMRSVIALLLEKNERWEWALRCAHQDYLDDAKDDPGERLTWERYREVQLEFGGIMRAESEKAKS